MHSETLGQRVSRERSANMAAQFYPATDADTLPCIEVAGIQVYAYLKGGYLRVSIDLDTVEGWLLADESGELLVPVRVQVGGEDVWCTSPGGTTVQQVMVPARSHHYKSLEELQARAAEQS